MPTDTKDRIELEELIKIRDEIIKRIKQHKKEISELNLKLDNDKVRLQMMNQRIRKRQKLIQNKR
jgi:cystathionine beta-lyase family protein involved in aluminum resistance